jgi:hypothetical protein
MHTQKEDENKETENPEVSLAAAHFLLEFDY